MSQLQIPKGWNEKKIKEICNVVRGGSPRPKGDSRYFGGDIPWIKISDATASVGKFIHVTKEGLKEEGISKSRFIKSGTLILTNSATICLPKIIKIDGCIHDGFLAFLDLDESVDQMYLYYYFLVNRDHITKNVARGMAQKNLNISLVEDLPIIFPEKEIQKKIVEKLDFLTPYLEDRKKEIFQLQKEKSKLFNEIFKNSRGFLFSSLLNLEQTSNVFLRELITDIKLGTNQRATYDSEGIPVLRMPNIQDGEIDYSDLKYSDFSKKDEEKYLLKKNDVLVNRTNSIELVGKSAVFSHEDKFAYASYIIRLRVNSSKIDPHFLVNYLNSPIGRKYIKSVYIKTAGQANINSENLKDMIIKLPSTESQNKILNNLKNLNSYVPVLKKELNNLKKSEEKTKNHLGQLTNTILNEAFAGRLVN